MGKGTWPMTFVTVLTVAASVPLFIWINSLADSVLLFTDSRSVALAFLLLAVAIWFFLHTALHELGHVIFGKLSGYEFLGVSVFGIWLMKDAGGRIGIRYMPVRGAGGATVMLPKGGYREDTPYTMLLMGGVLMNILTVIFLAVIIVLDIWPQMNFFIAVVAMIGVFFALGSSVPSVSGTSVNDAETLRLFRRDAASKHCAYFLNKRSFDLINGADPAACSDEPPADLPAGNIFAESVRLSLIGTDIILGRNDIAEAKLLDLLKDVKEGGVISGTAKTLLLFIRTAFGSDREAIDPMYDDKMKKFVRSFSRSSTEAILFLVAYERRFDTGRTDIGKLVKRFNALIRRSGTDASFERRMMDVLLSDDWEYLPKIN